MFDCYEKGVFVKHVETKREAVNFMAERPMYRSFRNSEMSEKSRNKAKK